MADTNNMRVWDVLKKTDPAHTKGFQRSGGFKGTAIKPIYCDERMTELFGPVGEGWGMTKPEFQLVTTEKEVLVYCTVGVWHGKAENLIWGVGGDKVVSFGNNGSRTSDEAFKMAYTDAIGNAYKRLGMSADVHMGLFDDSKYLDQLHEEFADKETKEEAAARAKTERSETGATWDKWVDGFKAKVVAAADYAAAIKVGTASTANMNKLADFDVEMRDQLRVWFADELAKKPGKPEK